MNKDLQGPSDLTPVLVATRMIVLCANLLLLHTIALNGPAANAPTEPKHFPIDGVFGLVGRVMCELTPLLIPV